MNPGESFFFSDLPVSERRLEQEADFSIDSKDDAVLQRNPRSPKVMETFKNFSNNSRLDQTSL